MDKTYVLYHLKNLHRMGKLSEASWLKIMNGNFSAEALQWAYEQVRS